MSNPIARTVTNVAAPNQKARGFILNEARETMTDDFGHECAEVRVLPLGGGGNILCGHRGYSREIANRIELNRKLSADCRWDLPAWESLRVYFPEVQS